MSGQDSRSLEKITAPLSGEVELLEVGFTRVLKKFKGKSMLSAAQVEDLVAYTMTLK